MALRGISGVTAFVFLSMLAQEVGTSGLFTYKTVDEPSTVPGPIILWWSGRLFLQDGLTQLECPNSVCYSTKDRKFLRDPRTRVVYFYGTDLDPEDLPLPRKAYHQWALYHEESPMNNYMLVHNTMLQLFNYTATFRRHSDYPLTSTSLPSLEYLKTKPTHTLHQKNSFRIDDGLAAILYVQSHCDVASDRDRYVRELAKFIQIDSVGACEHNKDIEPHLRDPVMAMEDHDFFQYIAKYKFHLAFENAVCEDYMTEKLYRPLHLGAVPIYRGSAKVKDWTPNNSVILVDDFVSPEALANYIHHLDTNDDAYMKFLEFKVSDVQNSLLLTHMENRQWGVDDWNKPNPFVAFECYICDNIVQRTKMENGRLKRGEKPKYATPEHMFCPQPHPSVGTFDQLQKQDRYM